MAHSRSGWLFGLPAGTKWRNLTANNTLLEQAPFGNLPRAAERSLGRCWHERPKISVQEIGAQEVSAQE
jgi:hypothetical protein